MINFYWPFRSLNLEKISDVRKRLKFLTKLINDKNTMMDYAIWSQKSHIEEEIRFLKSVLKKSKYAKSNINYLKNDKLVQETVVNQDTIEGHSIRIGEEPFVTNAKRMKYRSSSNKWIKNWIYQTTCW